MTKILAREMGIGFLALVLIVNMMQTTNMQATFFQAACSAIAVHAMQGRQGPAAVNLEHVLNGEKLTAGQG